MNNTYLKRAKSVRFLIISLLLVCSLTGCKKTDSERAKKVVVYTYHSFSDEWGAGPKIAELFEAKYGIKVEYAECPDSGQILPKAILEKDDPYADVIIGLDNNLAVQAYESGVLTPYVPSSYKDIDYKFFADVNPSQKIQSEEDVKKAKIILTPYDYSHFAFIFNTKSEIPAPTCLEDLTLPVYAKKIIIMDARTSTPGLGFKTWVDKVYGDKADDYMKRLEPSLLTVAPSWSVGYGMFTDGEAPLVISYTTSPAYHVEYDEGDENQALLFTDGHVMQVEGAGIVKDAKNKKAAELLIDFLVSEEAQNVIPVTQWMFPVNKTVKLPASYEKAAPIPSKTLN